MLSVLLLGFVGVVAAAVCFGLAIVLQAIGMRRAPSLAAAVLTWPMLVGIAVDVLGFVFELAALRHLPLFVVQAGVSASLAVTAVIAATTMGQRLSRFEWSAVLAVCLGLAALGLAAGPQGAATAPAWFVRALGAVLLVLTVAGSALARWRARTGTRTALLGLCAGLGFGILAVGTRAITDLAPSRLVQEPMAYVAAAAGVIGFLVLTRALASGSVTVATAAMVLGQTVLPTAVGVLVLGDRARPGFVPVAVVGFLIAVGGALALSRYGELEPLPRDSRAADETVDYGRAARIEKATHDAC
jgi:drug/metabolite transporter (DMT)-like permease